MPRIAAVIAVWVLATGCVVSTGVLGAAGHAVTKDGKVPICHKGKTLTVSASALNAHVRHGDSRGACKGNKKGKKP